MTLLDLSQGQVNGAIQHVNELRRAYPNDASVMVLEGEVYSYQRDYVTAAKAFNRAVANGGDRRVVFREYQARLDAQMADPEKPIADWLKANPDDTEARTVLAIHLQQTLSSDAAVAQYEQIIEQDPENAVALNNLAWHYMEAGSLDRAVTLAERARELDRSNGSITDTLAWIYRARGDLPRSLELLNEAARLAPQNPEIQFHLATVLAETGDQDRARRILTRLMAGDRQFPSRSDAEALLARL